MKFFIFISLAIHFHRFSSFPFDSASLITLYLTIHPLLLTHLVSSFLYKCWLIHKHDPLKGVKGINIYPFLPHFSFTGPPDGGQWGGHFVTAISPLCIITLDSFTYPLVFDPLSYLGVGKCQICHGSWWRSIDSKANLNPEPFSTTHLGLLFCHISWLKIWRWVQRFNQIDRIVASIRDMRSASFFFKTVPSIIKTLKYSLHYLSCYSFSSFFFVSIRFSLIDNNYLTIYTLLFG